jgi:hypothetical protein
MDRAAFFAAVRKDFGRLRQGQVEGFNAILDAWDAADPRFTAYGLATTWHETATTMQPIEEYGRGKWKRYGVPVNGRVYFGRGYVQLTWLANDCTATEKLGVDFVSHPEHVMEPKHAAAMLVRGMTEGWFTGRKLSEYFSATRDDPRQARKIINGLDKADTIAGYHKSFLKALRVAATAPPKPATEPSATKPAPAGFFARLAARFRKAA